MHINAYVISPNTTACNTNPLHVAQPFDDNFPNNPDNNLFVKLYTRGEPTIKNKKAACKLAEVLLSNIYYILYIL
jgi:hypothetical protein